MNRQATVQPTDSSRTCLAAAALSDRDLTGVVAAVAGRPVRVLDWAATELSDVRPACWVKWPPAAGSGPTQ
jgi:hypothetical protein